MTTEIIILITLIIMPLLMVVFGYVFSKKAPKHINYVFGYRTKRSMASLTTWIYAHKIIGLLWLYGGMIIEMIIIVIYVNDTQMSSNRLMLLYYLPIVYMLISIIITEMLLYKKFK